MEPAHVASACPEVLAPPLWMSELFPGCPTPPFATAWPVCGRECPTPCRAHGSYLGRPVVFEFTYDDRRRWLSTRRDGELVASCTYAGDRIERCTDRTVTWTFERGARGEILETHGEPDGIPDRYRYRGGDLVEMSEWDVMSEDWHVRSTFEYTNHRLVAQQRDPPALAYRYAGSRLVERDEQFAELFRATLDYDTRGRLHAVASARTSGDEKDEVSRTRFEYDAQDRLVRIEDVDVAGEVEVRTFEYCP